MNGIVRGTQFCLSDRLNSLAMTIEFQSPLLPLICIKQSIKINTTNIRELLIQNGSWSRAYQLIAKTRLLQNQGRCQSMVDKQWKKNPLLMGLTAIKDDVHYVNNQSTEFYWKNSWWSVRCANGQRFPRVFSIDFCGRKFKNNGMTELGSVLKQRGRIRTLISRRVRHL